MHFLGGDQLLRFFSRVIIFNAYYGQRRVLKVGNQVFFQAGQESIFHILLLLL